MIRLGKRHSRCWHEKIHSIAQRYPSTKLLKSSLLSSDELRSHTEAYLKKKRKAIIEGERDKRLKDLIQKHEALYEGELYFSVAACARFMSPEAVKLLLDDELKKVAANGTKLIQFLQATIAAHHENPLAIGEAESQLAEALIWCYPLPALSFVTGAEKDTGKKLGKLVKILVTEIPIDAILYPHVIHSVGKYTVRLQSYVDGLKDSCQWLEARAATDWFSDVITSPGLDCTPRYREVQNAMDRGFPEWRTWAEWKPCDTELAQSLSQLPLVYLSSPSKNLEYLVKMQIALNPSTNSFVYQYVCKTMQEHAVDLASLVAELKGSGRWLEAHEETIWFSMLLDPKSITSSGAVESIKLLESGFHDWKAWAAWDEQDSQLARTLVPFQAPDPTAIGQNFKTLIKCVLAGIRDGSLLRIHVDNLVRKYIDDLKTSLEALAAAGQWFQAYQEAECFSVLLNLTPKEYVKYPAVVRMLDHGFTSWRPWLIWRPDVNRLRIQERLTTQQRNSMLKLLSLEGPDFETSKQINMRQGIIARGPPFFMSQHVGPNKQSRFEFGFVDNPQDMLGRLSCAVAVACKVGSNAVDLLIHLCCSDAPIDENVLMILEESGRSADALITVDVLQILKNEKEDQTSQITAVTRLLPKLSLASDRTLREALAPRLARCISSRMREMQAILSLNFDNRTLVTQLHTIGMCVQAARWLVPLLDDSMRKLVQNWPISATMTGLNALQSDAREASTGHASPLSFQIDRYYTEYIIEAGTIDKENKDLVQSLIDLWNRTPPKSLERKVALRIAQSGAKNFRIQLECVKQLQTLPKNFVDNLWAIFERSVEEPCVSCIRFARLLASSSFLDHDDRSCWCSVLYDWLMEKDSALSEHTLQSMKINEWHQWVLDLQLAFPTLYSPDSPTSPKVLQPALHTWAARIGPYANVIQQVESIFGLGPPAQCFRTGFESQHADTIIETLKLLQNKLIDWDNGGSLPPAVHASLPLLKRDGSNANLLHQALLRLIEAETDELEIDVIDVYIRIIEIYRVSSLAVAPALLAGWLQNPDLANFDTQALKALADLLGINLLSDRCADVKASVAEEYISSEVTSLRAEAKSLSRLRRYLKAKDPDGVTALCLKLGINDTSALEDEVARLPHDLVDLIDVVDNNVVELHFPLTQYTALQRAGTGIRSAQSLVVRLLFGNGSPEATFCIHLDNDKKDVGDSILHSAWLFAKNHADCESISFSGTAERCGHVNRTTYHIARILWRHLQDEPVELAETYKKLKLNLDQIAASCIICGSAHGVRLIRSTHCRSATCVTGYLQFSLSDYTTELQNDIQVADLLFTAIQAAANVNNVSLLPNWPIQSFESITEVLQKLPPITSLRASKDIFAQLQHSDAATKEFLKRTFGHFGGFLVSASGQSPISSVPGQIRVPGMPGAYQFLLANAAPHLEKAFAARLGSGTSTVVFHGTSLDRLYSILCLGLQSYYVTRLGRYFGSGSAGIYVAEEPATSFSYMTPYDSHNRVRAADSYRTPNPTTSFSNPWQPGWNSGTFDNFCVLLACEATGIVHGSGVHVISDPSMLLLRYIFLIPANMTAPRAADIVPAMTSVFASLRRAAL